MKNIIAELCILLLLLVSSKKIKTSFMSIWSDAYSRKKHSTAILILLITCCSVLFSCQQTDVEAPDHVAHFDTILNQTNILINNGKKEKALAYMDSAYQAFPNPGTGDLWRKYDKQLNYYLNFYTNLQKARIYSDSMFLVLKSKEQRYKNEYAGSFFAQGDVLMKEHKYNEALKAYYEGKSFAEKNLDDCRLSRFSNKLGTVKFSQEQYKDAISYFKQALEENGACKINDRFDYTFIFPQGYYNSIAVSYELSGKLDSALSFYQQGLDFISANKDRFPDRHAFTEGSHGVIYGNMGGIYVRQGNYKKAEQFLTESIRINDRPGYEYQDAQTAKIKLANLYIIRNNFNAAGKLLNELESYLSKGVGLNYKNEGIRLKWLKLKYEFHNNRKEPIMAMPYLQRYYAVKDSINEVNKEFKTADLGESFKNSHQQYKLALLDKDNQLKTAYLLAAVICAFMVIVILIVVLYNLKHSRKINTQIIEQNANMQTTLNSLEQSQEENTKMMRIVAHDLRNPIGGITAMAGLMLDEPGRSEEDLMMLELIKTSGQNSLNLVNDLLRVHTQVEDLHKEPVDLYQMLNYCLSLLQYKAAEKSQHLSLQAKPVTLSLNREKMWRVISNLIGNAIKFSPDGATIEVSMEEKPQSVLIAVKDHGIGIPKHMHDKIFDMFSEAKRSGTAGEQPFGLGLAISKQIVEAHGGKIWFDSIPDEGSVFYIELPA